jgi:hypothetical protein
MSMKWVWGPNHMLHFNPMAKQGESPTTPTFDCETKPISGWGCILMTFSHSSRCQNTLYMYEEDLL